MTMLFLVFSIIGMAQASAGELDVSIVTGAGSRVLKSWDQASLRLLSKGAVISSQELIFESSTDLLDPNEKADVDLVTLYGAGGKISRVPRFMIWRGSLKFKLEKDGSISSRSSTIGPIMVPSEFFKVERIRRIELTRASLLYPGTRLAVRTNPAASRGQKMFTQTCLACHSLNHVPKLEATLLTEAYLLDFPKKHSATGGAPLAHRALRGLMAYRDALASEKSSVKSVK